VRSNARLGGARSPVTRGSEAGSTSARSWRWSHRIPAAIVLVVGMLAIATAATVILLQRSPRRSGANLTSNRGFVIPVTGGQQLCEPAELVPADTGAIRLTARAAGLPAPALGVDIRGPAGRIASGRLDGGWRPGAIGIRVTRTASTVAATVCVTNLGLNQVDFGGSTPDSAYVIQIGGRPFDGRLRIEYLRPGSESWLGLAPTLVHRFSLAKSDALRHWAAIAASVLVLLSIALALWAVLGVEPLPSEERLP
jgi:hypothetical protein